MGRGIYKPEECEPPTARGAREAFGVAVDRELPVWREIYVLPLLVRDGEANAAYAARVSHSRSSLQAMIADAGDLAELGLRVETRSGPLPLGHYKCLVVLAPEKNYRSAITAFNRSGYRAAMHKKTAPAKSAVRQKPIHIRVARFAFRMAKRAMEETGSARQWAADLQRPDVRGWVHAAAKKIAVPAFR